METSFSDISEQYDHFCNKMSTSNSLKKEDGAKLRYVMWSQSRHQITKCTQYTHIYYIFSQIKYYWNVVLKNMKYGPSATFHKQNVDGMMHITQFCSKV